MKLLSGRQKELVDRAVQAMDELGSEPFIVSQVEIALKIPLQAASAAMELATRHGYIFPLAGKFFLTRKQVAGIHSRLMERFGRTLFTPKEARELLEWTRRFAEPSISMLEQLGALEKVPGGARLSPLTLPLEGLPPSLAPEEPLT